MEGQLPQQERGSNVLQGLSVAHLSTHPQVLCAAARVCKGWREAVQQCSACNTEVVLDAAAPLPRLRSFAQWLAKHAALLSGITMQREWLYFWAYGSTTNDGTPRETPFKEEQELLLLSIHAAATLHPAADGLPAAAPATAEAPAAAALPVSEQGRSGRHSASQQQQQQSQRQCLRLRSFSSNLSQAVDVLAVLHPHSLTRVHLDLREATTDSSTLSKALKRLSSLQELCLVNVHHPWQGSALTALAHLSQLTSLELSGRCPTADTAQGQVWHQALAQLLAQPLPLQDLKLQLGCRLPALDMACLMQLTQLNSSDCYLDAESVLPQQLRRLTCESWDSPGSLAPVTRLQLTQLQQLSLRVEFTQQQPLLQLAQLPALKHLALRYGFNLMDRTHAAAVPAASATAPAWALLPQLRELEIECDNVSLTQDPTEQQMAAILAGVAAATSLTQLMLHAGTYVSGGPGAAAFVSLSSLSGLTRLRDLSIGCGPALKLAPGDALELTALTGLTRLHLWHARHELGATVATALARELKQLRSLGFLDCRLQLGSAEGMACLEAIGCVTQLTALSLRGNSGLTQQGVLQLTRLCHLQMLDVNAHGNAVTKEGVNRLLAAVRQQ
uniref:F-box domain-containing protein n=1 Tax=Tetradesmus obliquus TaxID=3088 RepID=A0A383VRL7_TETOB|eukprot:jgi/Sobl393_1/6148/SZX67530.1